MKGLISEPCDQITYLKDMFSEEQMGSIVGKGRWR